jgi:cytochrome P450
MLVMAKDEDGTGMPTEQIRAEAMTLFLAGHDTTANTLTWTWALLDQNPKVREKLQAELAEVLGGRAPTFEDLPKLVYTEQVIREAMRMYPPAWLLAREPIQEVALGGCRIPKQATVFISPYSVHHDPRWWADPEKFDPERFATGWEERIPKYAYIPFGGGPRICIGNSFAHMEARLILATIAQRWQMTLPPGAEVRPAPLVTLHPKGGLPMQLRDRVTAGAA